MLSKIIKLLFTVAIITIHTNGFTQKTNPSETVKEQATTMVNAFLKKDYNTFSKMTNQTAIGKMGGATKMIEGLKQMDETFKQQGISFSKITVGNPSNIITVGNEMQCTIPQTTEMKMAMGRAIAKSTLIAVTNNGGKNWYFADAAGKDLKTLRTIMPNLSDKLVIPQKEQPQFIPN